MSKVGQDLTIGVLGALTHGDRRATETRDLSQFNIDNKYGRAALEATMKTVMGYEVFVL